MKNYLVLLFTIFIQNITFAQGLSPSEKDGMYAFSLNKKLVTAFKYENYSETYFGYFFVEKADKWGAINSKGQEVIECKYDSILNPRKSGIIAQLSGKVGAIDTLGNIVIPFEYEAINYLSLNKAEIALVKKNSQWGNLRSDNTIDYTKSKVIFQKPEEYPLFEFCKEFKNDYPNLKKCADKKMMEYLYTKLSYPKEAIVNEREGIAVVSFVVTSKGKVTDVKVLRDPGSGCGKEAKRVVETFRKWIPAKQDGKKVASRMFLPVRFKLNE